MLLLLEYRRVVVARHSLGVRGQKEGEGGGVYASKNTKTRGQRWGAAPWLRPKKRVRATRDPSTKLPRCVTQKDFFIYWSHVPCRRASFRPL